MNDLDARLLQAHAQADIPALIKLYEEAADAASDEVAKGFYLTHAYVFALESGDDKAGPLRDRLVSMGREVKS